MWASGVHADLVTLARSATATVWGSSRWAEYRRCQYAHHLRYTRKLRAPNVPESKDARVIGTLVHSGLAYLGHSQMRGLSLPDPCDVLIGSTEDPYAVEEARRMLSAYVAYFGASESVVATGYELIGVEVPLESSAFALPYTTRVDSVWRAIDGRIICVDHKTSARAPSEDYASTAIANPQFLGHAWCARENYGGELTPWVLVNVLVKTRIPKFYRFLAAFSPEQLDRWGAMQLESAVAGVDGCGKNPGACMDVFGRKCWAFGHCHEGKELGTNE